MAKFAFIVPPLFGHINPTLSIGAELLSRGHEVVWISIDESLRDLLPKGGRVLLVRESGSPDRDAHLQHLNRIAKKNVSGIESIKFLYEEVLIPLNRFMFPGIVRLLKKFRPDMIVHDHQLFAGAFAACQCGIGYATSITAPAAIKMQKDLPGVHAWEQKQMKALQKELNIPTEKDLSCSDKLSLVYTTRTLFGEMNLAPHYNFTGPVLRHRAVTTAFDWKTFRQRKGGQAAILVSIGTTFNHNGKKAFFSKIAAALAGKPWLVVLVSDPDLFEKWPDNFMVSRQVPQVELLPQLNAVICHGGQNTVSESLFNGLPLIVIPIAYDQSYVAGRVVDTGCGLRLNYKRFKAEQLQEAAAELLDNPAYKQKALELQEEIRSAGGTATAANLLEAQLPKKEML